jgi:hypothetical protein
MLISDVLPLLLSHAVWHVDLLAIQWPVGGSFQYCRTMIMGVVDMCSKCLITQIWLGEDCCSLSVEIAPLSWIQDFRPIYDWSWAWKACICVTLMIYEQVVQLVYSYIGEKHKTCENSSLDDLLCVADPCRKSDVATWCRYTIYT